MELVALQDMGLLGAALCVFMVQAGHVTLESGIVRAKHSVNAAAKALIHLSMTVILFWAIGHALATGPSVSGLFGLGAFAPAVIKEPSQFLFALVTAAAAVTILSGAVAERMTTVGYMAAVALFACLVHPIIAHWIWGDGAANHGFLKSLGFLDFAGAAAIHVAGGAAALGAAAALGQRQGRQNGVRRAPIIQSQSFPFAALGALMLWLGWLAIAGGRLAIPMDKVPVALLTLAIAGSAGALVALAATFAFPARYGVVHLIHGLIAGTIAASAAAHSLSPALGLLIGAAGAAAALAGAELVERLRIDDALGVASAHLFAGAIGAVAAGAIGPVGPAASLGVQAAAVLAIALWSFAVVFGGLRLFALVTPIRVSASAEKTGLNVSEHRMTTDVALLVSQMNAFSRHSSPFSYIEADAEGEIGQIAREYNRAVDVFRSQVTSIKDKLEAAETVVSEARDDKARLVAELAVKDARLADASREVSMLADQVGRSVATIQGLEAIRSGVVRILTRAFKAPIERLHLLAKRAAETRDPKAIDELIETAREETARLSRRLADVIDFAEVSTLETLPEAELLHVERLIDEMHLAYGPRAEQAGLRYRVIWEPSVVGMTCNGPAMRRILSTLLENAIENNTPNGIVSLMAKRAEDGGLVVDVIDTGSGINPGRLATALDPLANRAFARGEEPQSVGLALAKRLVELMGGTMTFRSKPGVGTQARVEIPPEGLARAIEIAA